MRPRKIQGELKALIEQDLASGRKRKVICEERGVSYQQLSNEFGHTCKKPRKQPEPVAEPVN